MRNILLVATWLTPLVINAATAQTGDSVRLAIHAKLQGSPAAAERFYAVRDYAPAWLMRTVEHSRRPIR